jgi:phospholipid-binding lipoprotein MlaA
MCVSCATSEAGHRPAASLEEPVLVAQAEGRTASDAGSGLEYDEDLMSDIEGEEIEATKIPDPLEPMNRFFFEVNDKLYFVFIRPLATGYSLIVPEPTRGAISNFFDNLRYPIRLVSCLLQGKGGKAWLETQKFIVNTTAGMAGFIDLAQQSDDKFKISPEDLGQTFGYHGADHGFYLVLPVFGPSSLRDGLGSVGDYFLDPLTWYEPKEHGWALKGGDKLNKESLRLGDYEDLREAAIDPYTAVKDVYVQYRKALVEDKADEATAPPTP